MRVPGPPTPPPHSENTQVLQELLQLLPSAVVFLSADGRVAFANQAAHQLFCTADEQLVGKTRHFCIRRRIFEEEYLRGFDDADLPMLYFVPNVEEHCVTVGAKDSIVRATYHPVVLHGRFAGVLGTFEDLTAEREAAELRDDLMQMMCHDMQHPLAAIMLNLDGVLLLAERRLSDQQLQFIDTAKQKVQQLQKMFTEMVDIGKLEQQQLTVTLQPADMNDLVESVLRETFALQFDAAGKRLLFSPSQHLIPVPLDVPLIQRVIANLVDNALKFTPEGGSVEVRTALGRDRKSVRVHVRDQGPGIPRKFLKVIFEKYRQVHMRRAGIKTGAGLGLAFCKLAVEAHGGAIAARRAPQGGAEFMFRLPANPADLA